MIYASVKLEGAEQLHRNLNSLEPKLAKKVLRKAVREGEKVVAKKAKGNARSMIGGNMGTLIARQLRIRAVRRKRKHQYGVNALLNPDETDFIHVTKEGTRYFIPAAIEYGHGIVAAIPFMRSAFDSSKGEVANTVARHLRQGISTMRMKAR